MNDLYLIAYDIGKNSLRSKVSKKLLFYGLERIQYSVFAGVLSKTLFVQAEIWLNKQIVQKDRLMILRLPPKTEQTILLYGDKSVDWELILGTKNTLYID